ncbi:class I adenylate-forming enzyme family protein [Microbacterium immunditiarum]|uniref:Acyl-CoA synthetase n=1 Tax=Microbacterium immunditiarum TaxID=337480 RepID=A0A7Y9GL46_9MICO|nr:class I adenylate-forming enzyme family protein [Microbacterium immunditiarum]NYE18447.1 acyl-CoA synthetase [Microbacterium immunditiarum]
MTAPRVIPARDANAYPDIVEALVQHASRDPHRIAVADDAGATVTYGELERATRNAADWFRNEGVSRGDRVVIALTNCLEYVTAYLGLSALGATAVAMSARESGRDVQRAAAVTDARMVVVPGLARGERLRDGLRAAGLAGFRPVAVGPAESDFIEWPGSAQLAATQPAVRPVRRERDDLDFIVFSSGTTGTPKGIAHTVGGTSFSLWNWVRTLGLHASDGVFAPATFGHVGGLQWGLRTAIAAGALLAPQDRWDPLAAVEIIQRNACTYALVTPTYIADLAALPPEARARTSGFRLWTVGGSRMSADFVRRAEAALGGKVLRGFGMSETFMLTITRPDDPMEARLSHDGRALPGCELEIRDERGVVVTAGTPGELFVRSPSLVDGYFTDPAETAAAFDRGWFRTGDIATLTAEGYLTITDRRKEIVIRGGENISPQELEQVLSGFTHLPSFAVTGVPDERLGERVVFVHEGDAPVTLERLRELLASTSLAKYKWPEVSLHVDELPRTALGKIQRGELRRLAARIVGDRD